MALIIKAEPLFFVIAVVKFEKGRVTWSSKHYSPQPDPGERFRCRSFRLAMACQKANSHGSYVLSTYSWRRDFGDGRGSTEHWWTMTFDITTQKFSKFWREFESSLIWSSEYGRNDADQEYIHDQCFWNHNFLLSYSPKQGLVSRDEVIIKTISSYGKTSFPNFLITQAITLHKDCNTRSAGYQICMDDEFIVLRTDSGMAVFSPGEQEYSVDHFLWENDAKGLIRVLREYRHVHGSQIHPPSERCNLPYPEDLSGPSTVLIYD